LLWKGKFSALRGLLSLQRVHDLFNNSMLLATTLCALGVPFHLSLAPAYQTFWRKKTFCVQRLFWSLVLERVV
jgi:hypothetical protein